MLENVQVDRILEQQRVKVGVGSCIECELEWNIVLNSALSHVSAKTENGEKPTFKIELFLHNG